MKMTAYGVSPLHTAILNNHAKALQILIDAGANINAKNRNGEIPLLIAVSEGHEKVVKVLVGAGANLDRTDRNAVTPLMWASRLGHAKIVTALLEAGANINAKDNDGWTALSAAKTSGHEAVVELLKDAGAQGSVANPKFKGKKHIEQKGYVLCEVCKKPAQSLKEVEIQKKGEHGPKQYCPKCDAYYCSDHYKRGRWQMFCTAKDY